MDSKTSFRVAHERDRIALLVESRLRDLAREEGAVLSIDQIEAGRVDVQFDSITVSGENRDIAILRLANALLDHDRYGAHLTSELGHISDLKLGAQLS